MGAIHKVEVIANVASGSVGKTAPDEIEALLAEFGLKTSVRAPETSDLISCLRAAVDAAPDLLIILAGDGTARAAAEMCGPDGPMIAPLPGGTMNMLPHAVYGVTTWQQALKAALETGQERLIGGGEIDGHKFMVAAILGSPALWAPAREAARVGQARKAWVNARLALRRAFSGRLRYILDSDPPEKAEALVFMCPLTSRVLSDDAAALEAAALDVRDTAAAFRLGFHALTGDWRAAPGVEVEPCRRAHIWAARPIPAILDGETVRLKAMADVRYLPKVARILAIPKAA
ncbi:diacylglycerol kinase family protein [Phenylobacterium sp.]|uniref:diacylglycerol/lipid kinase family protein n=1 Tax=Phenylobacterium sp. TaxID=1871053 RepID=UPI00286ADCA0|nr:diacylglycerol kinase family protein [Phenylobacterium sp.]